MKKRFMFTITALVLAAVFTACKGTDSQQGQKVSSDITKAEAVEPQDNEDDGSVTKDTEEAEEFQPVDISAGGWSVILENYMRDSSMKNVATVLGYSDTTTTEFVQEAPEGKEYFLIKMKITKDGSKENLQWDKLTLTDQDKNVYYRTRDVFIEDLGMKRIPGTDLNFGSNEGWIAFEINEGAEKLVLNYPFEADISEYTFD